MKIGKTGLAAALASLVLLSACGGGNSANAPSGTAQGSASADKGAGQSTGDKPAPVEFTVMTNFFSQQPMADDNPVKAAVEEATNSRMDIQWVSSNNYTDKLNVTLVSGDIPDLIYINDPFSTVFRSMTSQGAFWDLGPYIGEYPNLSSGISETAWELTKMADGKNYAVPRPRPSEADTFFIVRKDWLDRVGLQAPTTTDELYAVMKAFVERDPDGNGKPDTEGFAAYIEPTRVDLPYGSLSYIEHSFTGVNGSWKWDGEKMIHTSLLPEVRESLVYITKAYAEKLIPADFASLKPTQLRDMFRAGRLGLMTEKAGTQRDYMEELKKIDPNVKDTDFYPVTNLNGYNPKGPGYNGVMAIPKSVPEEKMKRILQVMDTWMNPEVFKLNTYGLEGIHHKLENGEPVVDTEKMLADSVADLNQILYVADPYASSTKPFFSPESNELYAQVQDERAKTSVADISIGLYSETAQKALPEIEKKIIDLKTKVILGLQPIEAWDDLAAKLRDDPDMIKMSGEMTEAYKRRAGL
ncbi:ABC transporter substrate-binding protein [Cohnella cellulosilytica]|uniref:ABC transporter substrate-binding protein n=1 Tax=Cohnella cellulosilytica TaxID=986710 RepID=A0ABW2F503_9BACL